MPGRRRTKEQAAPVPKLDALEEMSLIDELAIVEPSAPKLNKGKKMTRKRAHAAEGDDAGEGAVRAIVATGCS